MTAVTARRPARPAKRLCERPQVPDLVPPSGSKTVALDVLAFLPDTALAKRQLVLRVHQRRRCAGYRLVDAPRPQCAIPQDLLILGRHYCASDFLRQLFTDHPPFPHAASPQRQRNDDEERQEDYCLSQAFAHEGVKKPYGREGLVLWRRLAPDKRGEKRQGVVQHVCRDGNRQPADRCEDASPPAPNLNGDTKECAEHGGKQCMPAEPEQGISAAEL